MMTNKEKREYFNLALAYKGKAFIAELQKKNSFYKKIPKKLYKFRKFDDFSIDMLENEYLYIAPAGSLDDPFDCLTNINLDRVYKKGTYELSDEIVSAIIDIVSPYCESENYHKSELIRIFKECTKGEVVDKEILTNELTNAEYLNNEQKDLFHNVMTNLLKVIDTVTTSDEMKNLFISLINSKTTIGVCSLTTKRDNKVMWSLYGNTYKGYCVEYDEVKENEIVQCLKPVIYSKKSDNDIIITMVKFSIETLIRDISMGKLATNIGVFDELVCTKDSDWSFQDEWRIVANSNSKVCLSRL